MKKITEDDDAWKIKFQFLIERFKTLTSEEGKKMVLINVEAHRNPKKQFDKYMKAVESVRNKIECIVSTSLPGEERIFWPYYDAQFYIRDDKEAISSTGNQKIIQRVFNYNDQEINTFLPEMDYWKGKDFIFRLDSTDYVDEQGLLSSEFELNTKEVIEKYGHYQTRAFENKDWWYILKFFFIASEFQNLDGFGDLIGGIPKTLKVKCECQNLVNVELFLKGIFKVPEQDFEHQYYLYISRECESCGELICIYRPRGPLCPHLMVFMNYLLPERNIKMSDIEMVAIWQETFKKAAIKDMNRFQQLYSEDIIKFGMFIQEMDNKYNKS